MIFRRSAIHNRAYGPISEREEISISSFGRDPTRLKELLNECCKLFLDSNEDKSVIFRAGNKPRTEHNLRKQCDSCREKKGIRIYPVTNLLHFVTPRYCSSPHGLKSVIPWTRAIITILSRSNTCITTIPPICLTLQNSRTSLTC
jgi:hypothetical protein